MNAPARPPRVVDFDDSDFDPFATFDRAGGLTVYSCNGLHTPVHQEEK